jgi:predicted nucleic acid-binding protein
VLNLAIDLMPDVILLDDRKARNEAKELGLLPTFTSDVLKEAEVQGLIPSYRELFQTLNAHYIYLPES